MLGVGLLSECFHRTNGKRIEKTYRENVSRKRIKSAEMEMKPGGGHFYIKEDMDVCHGLSNPYPLQTKPSAKFWTFCRQMAEIVKNMYPETSENEYLAAYLCIFEKNRKISVN